MRKGLSAQNRNWRVLFCAFLGLQMSAVGAYHDIKLLDLVFWVEFTFFSAL